ncbi:MAG: type II toxin-antitoxin system PemK/MazF family toxin [Pseudomonadota bacterium]
MPISEPVPPQWSVVVLPFPYADQLAEKRRPALVISNHLLGSKIVWVAMITSAANQPWRDDIEIDDLQSAGLPAPSVIRPAKIATIDVDRIERIAGTVSGAIAARTLNALSRFLDDPATTPV